MRKTIIGLVALCWANAAPAIVNVENLRFDTPQKGVSGNLDFSVSGKNGNTDKEEIAIASHTQWLRDNITNFVVVSYDYGENNDQKNSNKAFIHGRHVVQFEEKLAWEAFSQIEQNEFARLSFRGLVGAGLRYTLSATGANHTHLGLGGFYSRETLEYKAGLTDHGSENFGRANIYLSYKHKLNEHTSLISTTYYQPRFGDSGDFRALEQAAIGIKMSQRLQLKISLNIAHDSRPPQTVSKTDTSYKMGISFQF